MSWWDNLLEKAGFEVQSKSIPATDPNFGYHFGYPDNNAGVSTSPYNVRNIDTVFACVRALSEPFASMPKKVVKLNADGSKTPQPNHPIQQLLKRPNTYQTGQVFGERAMWHCPLKGEHFAVIHRDEGTARPKELELIDPQYVDDYVYDDQTDELWWRVSYNDEPRRNSRTYTRYIPHSDMLHVPILNDGVRGTAIIRYFSNDFANSIATLKYGNNFFASDGVPGAWVETIDHTVGKEKNEAFAKSMTQQRQRVKVFPYGRKLHMSSTPPNQGQFIENRIFTTEVMCRIFNVPGPIVQHFKDGANYTSMDVLDRSYAKRSILPYSEKFDAEYTFKLFSPMERARGYRIETDYSNLLKADPKTKADVESKQVMNGLRTPNELRAADGLEAMAGADELFMQQQMTPVSKLEEVLMNRYGSNRPQGGNGKKDDEGKSDPDPAND